MYNGSAESPVRVCEYPLSAYVLLHFQLPLYFLQIIGPGRVELVHRHAGLGTKVRS